MWAISIVFRRREQVKDKKTHLFSRKRAGCRVCVCVPVDCVQTVLRQQNGKNKRCDQRCFVRKSKKWDGRTDDNGDGCVRAKIRCKIEIQSHFPGKTHTEFTTICTPNTAIDTIGMAVSLCRIWFFFWFGGVLLLTTFWFDFVVLIRCTYLDVMWLGSFHFLFIFFVFLLRDLPDTNETRRQMRTDNRIMSNEKADDKWHVSSVGTKKMNKFNCCRDEIDFHLSIEMHNL